jgi:hypothetical protein
MNERLGFKGNTNMLYLMVSNNYCKIEKSFHIQWIFKYFGKCFYEAIKLFLYSARYLRNFFKTVNFFLYQDKEGLFPVWHFKNVEYEYLFWFPKFAMNYWERMLLLPRFKLILTNENKTFMFKKMKKKRIRKNDRKRKKQMKSVIYIDELKLFPLTKLKCSIPY